MSVQIAWEAPDQPEVLVLIDELDQYHSELYPAESNHLLAVNSLLGPDVLFCVARLNGEPVGCGAAVLHADYAEIKRMFVSPACRGEGVGWRMLEFVEAELVARDVSVARLETGIHQPAATRLYERSGYRSIPPFGDYWEDPLSLFYEKVLVSHG